MEPSGRGGQPRRVVVADDDEDISRLLVMTLEADGYLVHAATDGLEARELILATVPDLVVLDWMMPGMDGLEVLTAVRAHPRTREIPVVLLTARTSDADLWDGWQAGADYYLTKPFDPDELLRYLAYLEGSSRSDDATARRQGAVL